MLVTTVVCISDVMLSLLVNNYVLLVDQDLYYQLKHRQESLINMCTIWQVSALEIPCAYATDQNWGPTPHDITKAQQISASASWNIEDETDENDGDEEDIIINDEHEDLWDALEISAFADAYRGNESEMSLGMLEIDVHDAEIMAESLVRRPSRSISPAKKSRI
jgi:hypothetical protein